MQHHLTNSNTVGWGRYMITQGRREARQERFCVFLSTMPLSSHMHGLLPELNSQSFGVVTCRT